MPSQCHCTAGLGAVWKGWAVGSGTFRAVGGHRIIAMLVGHTACARWADGACRCVGLGRMAHVWANAVYTHIMTEVLVRLPWLSS